MTWEDLDPELRRRAEQVLTPAQLEVMRLKAHGLGDRVIARQLGITREAVRDRADKASLKLRRAERA